MRFILPRAGCFGLMLCRKAPYALLLSLSFISLQAEEPFFYLHTSSGLFVDNVLQSQSENEIRLLPSRPSFLKQDVTFSNSDGDTVKANILIRLSGHRSPNGVVDIVMKSIVRDILITGKQTIHTVKKQESERHMRIPPNTSTLTEFFGMDWNNSRLRITLTLTPRSPSNAEKVLFAIEQNDVSHEIVYRYRVLLIRFLPDGTTQAEPATEMWGRPGKSLEYRYEYQNPLLQKDKPGELFVLELNPVRVGERTLLQLKASGKVRCPDMHFIAMQSEDNIMLEDVRNPILKCTTLYHGKHVGFEARINVTETTSNIYSQSD